jgi:hypothetical protein
LRLATKLVLAGALLIVLVLVIGAVWLVVWSSSLESKVEQHRAAAREAGEPVTLEELDAWYPHVPDAENAALEEADPERQQLQSLLNARAEFDRMADCPPGLIAETQKYAADAAPAVAILGQAEGQSQSRFPVDMKMGYAAELPHLSPLRDTARLLSLASEAALIDNDAASALGYHKGILALANAVETEPFLISQLVHIAIEGLAIESLIRMVSHTQLDNAELSALDDAYVAAGGYGSLRRALIGERCTIVDTTRRFYAGTLESYGDETYANLEGMRNLPGPIKAIISWKEELAIYESFEPLIPGPDSDWPSLVSLSKEGTDPGLGIMAAIMMPNFDRVYLPFLRAAASGRIARATIAVERYRLAHGALPASLTDCLPEFLDAVPEDPYDGAPLRYRREVEGYVLYTIYEDFDDDGGTPYVKLAEGGVDGDNVFTVSR